MTIAEQTGPQREATGSNQRPQEAIKPYLMLSDAIKQTNSSVTNEGRKRDQRYRGARCIDWHCLTRINNTEHTRPQREGRGAWPTKPGSAMHGLALVSTYDHCGTNRTTTGSHRKQPEATRSHQTLYDAIWRYQTNEQQRDQRRQGA